MAKGYTHLTPEERYYIRARLKAGDSRSEVARSLGRSRSTVSRELKRNSGLRGYRPKQAQRLADARHAARPRGVRLTEDVKSQVIGKLRGDWSPEQISGTHEDARAAHGCRTRPSTGWSGATSALAATRTPTCGIARRSGGSATGSTTSGAGSQAGWTSPSVRRSSRRAPGSATGRGTPSSDAGTAAAS